MEGATMKTSSMGYKTYYVFDRTGTIRPISTKAYYVKELKQDLLGGSALTSERYRVILDKDDNITGIYPVADNGTIDLANSFSFASEYSGGLFYHRTAPIDATKFFIYVGILSMTQETVTLPEGMYSQNNNSFYQTEGFTISPI